MSWLFPALSLGALVELRCPHCRHVQLRARLPAKHEYACKRCRRPFRRLSGSRVESDRRRAT